MKTLKVHIKTCSDCPYSVHQEYDDVGTSFGYDYHCSLGATIVQNPTMGWTSAGVRVRKPISFREREMNLKETETQIRKDCPL